MNEFPLLYFVMNYFDFCLFFCFLKKDRVFLFVYVNFGCRYLSWDDYFMAIAFLSAERSKDPNRQVKIICILNTSF